MDAVTKIFSFRSRYLTVAIDGKSQKYRAAEVTISNCDILSKILYPMGPDVSMDDGHLDVWILSAKTFLDYPRYLFEMIAHRPQKHLSHFINSEKSVSITSRVPLQVQADGDIIGTTPIKVDVLPGAVTVLVPEIPVPPADVNLDIEKIISQYLSGFGQTARRK
jgi:diacylglycerol kinase (ATP)